MKYLYIILINIVALSSAQAEFDEILPFIDNYKELTSLDESCPVDIYTETEFEFQDRIDVCAEATNSCLLKCLDGSANHCFGLAINLQAKGVDDKYPNRLFSMACKQGYVTGVYEQVPQASCLPPPIIAVCYAESFKFTCGKSDSWGCAMYGMLLAEGIGVKQDKALAQSALDSACKNDSENAACEFARSINP